MHNCVRACVHAWVGGCVHACVCVCVCVCAYVYVCMRACMCIMYNITFIVPPLQKLVSDLQKEIGEQQQKQDRVVKQTAKLQKEIRAKKGMLEATAEEVPSGH